MDAEGLELLDSACVSHHLIDYSESNVMSYYMAQAAVVILLRALYYNQPY